MVILSLSILACEGQKGETPYQPAAQTLEEKNLIPQKKYALLIVESKSCIYCKQLNKDIETERELKEALKDIDLFRILYESKAPVRANFGGEIRELSVYPQQLICLIDYVKTEAYKQEDVNTYVKKKGCA